MLPSEELQKHVQIECDARIFALFCALTCCGYEPGGKAAELHPLRREIRRSLENISREKLRPFHAFLQASPRFALTPADFPFWPKSFLLAEYTLHLGPPPTFASPSPSVLTALAEDWPQRVPVRPAEIEPLSSWLGRLSGVLADFWETAQVEKFYAEFAPQCLAAAGLSQTELAAQIQQCFEYMEVIPPAKRLIIIPNPLQDPNAVDFVRTTEADYIIEGRCPLRPNSICHELCHPVIEELLRQNPALVAESEPLLAHVEEPMREMGYWLADRASSWRRVVEENLVRAVCDRLDGANRALEAVRDDIDHGFAFVAYAASMLEKIHEREGQSFASAVAAILEHLVQFANSKSYLRQA
jgi:hypothetical protein